MTDTPDKSEEKPVVCSRDSLNSLSKKKNRILVISSNEDKKVFSQKFADTMKTSDLEVIRYQTGNSCEVVEDLGLKDKPAAVLIEKGKVKARMDLSNDDVKDTADLTKMVYEKKDSGTCKVDFAVDGKGWSITPESSAQCKETISNIDKQGPAAKKYLKKHLK